MTGILQHADTCFMSQHYALLMIVLTAALPPLLQAGSADPLAVDHDRGTEAENELQALRQALQEHRNR